MEEKRRKLLLDRLAAGQWNGLSPYPSKATKRAARDAFDELCREDEGFRGLVERNRRSREERRFGHRLRKLLGI